jgi:hypothetical protein
MLFIVKISKISILRSWFKFFYDIPLFLKFWSLKMILAIQIKCEKDYILQGQSVLHHEM